MVDNCAYNGLEWCQKPLKNQQVLTTIFHRLKGYEIDKNGWVWWRQGGVAMGNAQMVGPNSPSFSTLFSSHSSMLYYYPISIILYTVLYTLLHRSLYYMLYRSLLLDLLCLHSIYYLYA